MAQSAPATPNVSVTMARHDLERIPRHAVPDGYAIRAFAPGDADAWVEIQSVADACNEITPALFRREFGDDLAECARRILVLDAPDGAAIGTAAAWYEDAQVGRTSGSCRRSRGPTTKRRGPGCWGASPSWRGGCADPDPG